jgi:hypothetical protein
MTPSYQAEADMSDVRNRVEFKSIAFINHHDRDDLKTVKTLIPLCDRNYMKIINLIDSLIKDAFDNYRYGNNVFERWITKRRIAKLNKMISSYNVRIV